MHRSYTFWFQWTKYYWKTILLAIYSLSSVKIWVENGLFGQILKLFWPSKCSFSLHVPCNGTKVGP